ncbi:exported hypothetical protein [Acidobacteriia bacterium SbA2]|nr:exported hypothetical protein [Acidobacteriia bacterium SbA2]
MRMNKVAIGAAQLLGAIALAGLCIALAFSKIEPSKLWPVWFTALLYGYLCYLSRSLWRRRLYWLVLAASGHTSPFWSWFREPTRAFRSLTMFSLGRSRRG